MSTIAPRYLGDGVFASFDGFQIWLKTTRGTQNHFIALEPAVMEKLSAYARDIDAEQKRFTSKAER